MYQERGKAMKKIFAITMAILLMAAAFCFATTAEGDSGYAMRVSGLKGGEDTPIVIQNYSTPVEGWEAAIDFARDCDYMRDNGYVRIVVDLLVDWNATDGEFCNSGDGFEWDAIYFYPETKITLNMHGHTIDRGLTSYNWSGEVMYIAKDADVIINGGKPGDDIIGPEDEADESKMGTITGGFSSNGAGGIHIDDGATVVLNNVCLDKNAVEDDKGSALAMYDGVDFTMNGGRISENRVTKFNDAWEKAEGTVFVDDSTAVFNKVTFSKNDANGSYGAAVSVNGNSSVTLNGCLVEEHGADRDDWFDSVFYTDDRECVLTLKDTDVIDNGTKYPGNDFDASAIFNITGTLYINNDCLIKGNKTTTIFAITRYSSFTDSSYCHVHASNSTFVDNNAQMFYYNGDMEGSYSLNFTNCTLNKNLGKWETYTFASHSAVPITFTDCSLGNTSHENGKNVKIVDTDASNGAPVASLFGTGSIAMIVSLVALIASAASIVVNVTSKKKEAHNGTNNDGK